VKKYLFLVLVFVVVAGVIMSGCASPAATTTAPSPSVTAAPAPAASATTAPAPKPSASATAAPAASKVIRFTVAQSSPEGAWLSAKAMRPFLQQIVDATNGRVQFDVYYDQTLAKQNQVWQAVQNGVADLGFIVQSSFPGLTPLTDASTLPFLTPMTAKPASSVLWKLYEKFPTIQAEFKSIHVLSLHAAGPAFLGTVKKEIKTVEDLKGLRMKTGGGLPVAQSFQALGMAPITMAAADTYLNMQKGVVDGGTMNWDMFGSYKLYEVTKYYTYAPFYSGNFSFIMNNDKFNSLPKDVQDAISGVSGLKASEFWGYNQFDLAMDPTRADIKKAGFPMNEMTFTQADVDKMVTVAGKPIWDKWIKDMTAAGHPEAKDIVGYLQELLKTYK
jgi:TRAP-type transport system periplasmic protein